MKLLIPTAKELNLQAERLPLLPLPDKTQEILAVLSAFSLEDLAAFYKISLARAEQEWDFIQQLQEGQAAAYPALELFDGLMYRQIKRQDYTDQEAAYLRDHVCITSALYGVIPALTPISPHRLDFLMGLQVKGRSLKSFWRSDYDQALAGEEKILSLLSSEFETVFSKEIRDRMLRFKFVEDRGGQLKVHSTISKKARGQFLTALIEGQVEDVEEMKSLTFADFSYRPDLSSSQELVFVKSGG